MAKQNITRLLTNKSNLGETRTETVTRDYDCAKGDVVLKIRQASVTTNNITYAAFGDAMSYWGFFPTDVDGWGHMPVWGFADVVQSSTDGIEIGERFYGYFPIASHIIMNAVRVTERGFYDGRPHRAELTSAYNQYTRCSVDPGYSSDKEHYQCLLRPLYITSYMLADFLEDNDFFDAERLVFSSASSKTGYGTAYSFPELKGIEKVGLTSSGNVEFVEKLGCYDKVQTYDNFTEETDLPKTVYVDFSGDEALRAKIHMHYGTNLLYDCYAGSAQNTEFFKETELPGPKPVFYFAPIQIRKRNKDWGGAELTRRFAIAQNAFIARISDENDPWMRIREIHGYENTGTLVKAMFEGRIDPSIGNIIVLDAT